MTWSVHIDGSLSGFSSDFEDQVSPAGRQWISSIMLSAGISDLFVSRCKNIIIDT